MIARCDVGVVGIGTMGKGLALNWARHGRRVALFDRDAARVRALGAADPHLRACADEAAFAFALGTPRRVLVMVNAGVPVDEALDALVPHLGPGDIVMDGGNSHYRDTQRRTRALASCGVDYLGVGISGGEEGAREGAALMAGGAPAAYARVAPLLADLAARAGDSTCLARVGGDGAGHFVKMVHNGIEYAAMQTIAEAWLALDRLCGLAPDAAARRFARWNEGKLRSYLIETAAEILALGDKLTGRPLIETVRDNAGQKGTGLWAAIAALELGVPAPSLAEAVFARMLSGNAPARAALARSTLKPLKPAPRKVLLGALEPALDAAILAAYAQGFALIAEAARVERWDTELAAVAAVWQGGCIVRAACLGEFEAAFRATPTAPSPLAHAALAARIEVGLGGLRRAVAATASSGLPVPCLAAALNYLDALKMPVLWTALVQAQRDRFGAHGFERTDRPGKFHLDGGPV